MLAIINFFLRNSQLSAYKFLNIQFSAFFEKSRPLAGEVDFECQKYVPVLEYLWKSLKRPCVTFHVT
jgi:hypothetical protein